MRKAFICTNKKQMLGALLSRFSLERASGGTLSIEIIVAEEVPTLQAFEGTRFRRGGEMRVSSMSDLQSFTLTRFMPPELMGYQGEAFVIDPDIFALKDPSALFSFLEKGVAIAACAKKGAWDTSVMVLDCAKLSHWSLADMLEKLKSGEREYDDYMMLRTETAKVVELPRTWNSLDHLDETTCMLHTTQRITQPWKTGLPIDFTRNRAPKIAGLIPREPFLKLLGKYPSRYLPHPDKGVESFFFALTRDALAAGALTRADIEREIAAGHIRSDLIQKIG